MATTTPNYGWDVPTSTDYVKDGATAIETLGDDIDATLWTALGGAYPGLRLVKKQTIGSGVSTVAVTSAFSSTYDNYRIIISGGVASTFIGINFTLGATATGYYRGGSYQTYASASSTAVNTSNGTSWPSVAVASTNSIELNMDLFNPNTAKVTTARWNYVATTTTGEFAQAGGFLNNTTQYTDFTLTPSGGTLTGGTIYVYGYGAS